MSNLVIEFTNEALVVTENGVERLVDILHRPVDPSLWAIKWCFKGHPNGISFHKSHKVAKAFAQAQIDSQPDGPARLVNVSPWLYENVQEHDYCWTNIDSFDEAVTYQGPVCSH